MSKHIVLISPPGVSEVEVLTFPNGCMSLGSNLLERGFAVTILDGNLLQGDQYFEKLSDSLSSMDVLFVGISAMTTQLPQAILTAQIIKGKYPHLPIVWGGVHATLFPEETVRENFVDLVVIGEAEETVIEIANALKGKSAELKNIKGIAYKDENGKCVFTGARVPPDLGSLPIPKHDLLFDLEKYISKTWIVPGQPGKKKLVRIMPVRTGMGCSYRCTFCINTIVYRDGKYYMQSSYRGKSAKMILDEIKLLIEKYNVNYFEFVDENFFADKKRLFKFLDGIENRKLKFYWSTTARVDYFRDNYITAQVVKRMKDNGCMLLAIGAESGSQKILDYLKKDCTVDQIVRAVKVLNRQGIFALISFIVGLPNESVVDMFATIDLIKKLINVGPFVMIQVPSLYRPLPGGSLYEDAVKLGFKGPERITAWTEELLHRGGGLKDDLFPWIANNNKTLLVSRYIREILVSGSKRSFVWWWRVGHYKSLTVYLFNYLVKMIAMVFQVRRRFDFWSFPFEWFLLDYLKKKKSIVKKS